MCYAGPLIGAIVSSAAWCRTKSIKTWWLFLMFLGGASFGVIDHLWNGELFLISRDFGRDLGLGLVISACIMVFWWIATTLSKVNPTLANYVKVKS